MMVKQTIRLNTFETNSSSYHSLSIITKEDNIKNLPRGGVYTLDLNSIVMRNSNTTWLHRTEVDKLKSIVNFLGYVIEEQYEELGKERNLLRDGTCHTEEKINPNYDENKPESWTNSKVIRFHVTDDPGIYFRQLSKEDQYNLILDTPIMQALKLSLNDVCELSVINKLESDGFDISNKDIINMLRTVKSDIRDLKDIENLASAFKLIIFNKDIIIKHKCDSNED